MIPLATGGGGCPEVRETPNFKPIRRRKTLQIQKQEFSRCKHIRVNGVRCGSPSLHEKLFCYYHNRARKLHVAPVVPILEDANALQFALSEVLQAIQDDQIDLK